MFFKLILIPMMIKALLASRRPGLCAAIYGAALFTNDLMFDLALGGHWDKVLLKLAISTISAFAFFWALVKAEDMGPVYWAVLVIGVSLMVFIVP